MIQFHLPMSILGSWFLNRRSKEGCHEICIFFPPDAFHKALFYYASSSLIINKTKSHQGFYVHGNLQSKRFSSYSAHLNKGKKCKKMSLLIGLEPVSGDLFFTTNTFTDTGRRISYFGCFANKYKDIVWICFSLLHVTARPETYWILNTTELKMSFKFQLN